MPANRVVSVCFSPNNARLAVATADRVVSLFDEAGERRDKFATKPGANADKGGKALYAISGLAWSPDCTRLAVAQTDAILFVYRLGTEWTDKKSICNKFPASSAITAVAWPSLLSNDLVFGCADGKVRQGGCRANKAVTLYAVEGSGAVTALAPGPDGHSLLSAHADGTIYRIVWDEEGGNPGHSRVAAHSCAPFALAWLPTALVAAGADGRVCFYDPQDGTLARTFERAREGGGPVDWTSASASPSGEAVVLGTYGGPALFALGPAVATRGRGTSREWGEVAVAGTPVPGLHTATCVAWKPDGSRLAVGSVGGSADVWDACLRRTRWRGRFEFTYVSTSSVIVKRLATGVRIVLASVGGDITRVSVVAGGGERYIAAYTAGSLLLGDLEQCRLSEVTWGGPPGRAVPAIAARPGRPAVAAVPAQRDRFFFDVHPAVALVARAGELTVVEFGTTSSLAAVRTEHVARSTVSVRLLPAVEGQHARPARKRLAYLPDAASLAVLDMASGNTLLHVAHDARVEWLELSGSGGMLLFRDRRKRLQLVDVDGGAATRVTLLPHSSFAAWVPGADVIVAQARETLAVWYNPSRPDLLSPTPLRGEVHSVVREGARVEVLVSEGVGQSVVMLDGALIGFGAALDGGDLATAAAMLEGGMATSGASQHDALWAQLGSEAMAAGELEVAERAALATGDMTRAGQSWRKDSPKRFSNALSQSRFPPLTATRARPSQACPALVAGSASAASSSGTAASAGAARSWAAGPRPAHSCRRCQH